MVSFQLRVARYVGGLVQVAHTKVLDIVSQRLIVVFCLLCCTALPGFDDSGFSQAQHELFAGHYETAASIYTKLISEQPAAGDAWYGLVRSLLELHDSHQAFARADEGLASAPQTPGAETAAGLAEYRRGDLAKAELHLRAALKISPNYPGALRGMAAVYSSVSKPKTARELRLKAYRISPNDPDLMLAYANTLKGAEHIAALEAVLREIDATTELARNLKTHVANDRVIGDRKLRRLTSPYQAAQVKLVKILDGPQRLRGFGLRVTLNQKENVKLLLDTGAAGISLAPKLAEKAGLQVISGETSDAKGIGDGKPLSAVSYLASEIRMGDVVFADYPISVFRSAQSADFDGLIGADVFARFLVTIDFPKAELALETRAASSADAPDDSEPVDANEPAPGFFRVLRFGDHLAIPTRLEGGRRGEHSALFLVDSGATTNLIDTQTAKEASGVSEDSRIVVKGVQGRVDKTSRTGRIALVFAGFRQDNNDLLAIDMEKMDDSMGVGLGGILGMPVLNNFAVTIDYRNGTVKLDYKKP